jgi:muramidase (phage lysozyme)
MVRLGVGIKISILVFLLLGRAVFCQEVKVLAKHRKDPRIKAFLDTIAYAEGTFAPEGYRTQYTYTLFDSFKDHPRQVNCAWYKGELLCSSAAGRYQFLQSTWDRLVRKIGVRDFSPENQDKAAIQLLSEQKAVGDIKAGRIKAAIEKVCTIWASLPGATYGQPTRSLKDLEKVYKERLRYHQGIREKGGRYGKG